MRWDGQTVFCGITDKERDDRHFYEICLERSLKWKSTGKNNSSAAKGVNRVLRYSRKEDFQKFVKDEFTYWVGCVL